MHICMHGVYARHGVISQMSNDHLSISVDIDSIKCGFVFFYINETTIDVVWGVVRAWAHSPRRAVSS